MWVADAIRRHCIDRVRYGLGVSERRACRVLGQHRSTQRHIPRGWEDEGRLVADMIELARQYGCYSYRRIAALLRQAGWRVNDKRIERLWKREGLKVPSKQPKRARLWFNDGSWVRLGIFYILKEAQIVIEEWRRHYNTVWPHSALGYRPPAPEAIVPLHHRPSMH